MQEFTPVTILTVILRTDKKTRTMKPKQCQSKVVAYVEKVRNLRRGD